MRYKEPKNLIGQIFHNWEVIGPYKKEKTNISWRCKCICGEIHWVHSSNLRAKSYPSRGCRKCCQKKSDLFEDLSGKIFGKLTVKEFTKNKSGKSVWLCTCECGKEVLVGTARLRHKVNGKSCLECRRKGYPIEEWDQTGKIFGSWTVEKLIENTSKNKNRLYKCVCKCGNITNMSSGNIRKQSSKSCKKCKSEIQKVTAECAYWNSVLCGARNRGIDFKLSRDYIFDLLKSQNFKCALSGRDICIAIGRKEHQHGGTSASLDRIYSSLGYLPDNIQWVDKHINRLKGTLSQIDFINLCRDVVNTHGKT